jgi:hypothetical protein
MVVVPVLGAELALSWWQARVGLPDEDKPKPRAPRTRPMTVRPSSQTESAPPPDEAITETEIPLIISDLAARVAAAAGIERPTSADSDGVVRHSEHAVIDDGQHTTSMPALEPSALGPEPGAHDDPDAGEAGDGGEGGEGGEAGAGEGGEGGGGDKPATGRGPKKRRKRR